MTSATKGAAQPAKAAGGALATRWLVVYIVCMGELMTVVDTTIVNVAMPTIQRDLHLSLASLQWVINADTLLFGGFLLLGGRLADILGRKRLFIAGLVLFTLASLVNGLADTGTMLIISRAAQGLGGALLTPAALSIVTTTFEDQNERAKALSIWGTVVATAASLGLVLGGVLTQLLSWRWIFFVNIPIGIVTLAAAVVLIPESVGRLSHRTFDVSGAIFVTFGLVLALYALVDGQSAGWVSVRTLSEGAVAIALLVAFFINQKRSDFPLVRLSMLRVRTVGVANATQFLCTAGVMSMFFFTSLYLQDVYGDGALTTGLLFLPATVAVMVGMGLAARLIDRLGLIKVGTIGLLVSAAGMSYFIRIPVHGSYLADVLPGMLPRSIGLGMSFVPLIMLATAVREDDSGLASGLLNAVGTLGGAVGLAVLSTAAADRTAHVLASTPAASHAQILGAEVSGYRLAFAGGTIIVVLSAILYAVFLRGRRLPSFATGRPAEAAAQEEGNAAADTQMPGTDVPPLSSRTTVPRGDADDLR
jgi:EmrB/QacA subfamily drug resistance transporter